MQHTFSVVCHRDYRFKLPKNTGKQGKLFETSLKWPKLACTAAVGVEQLHVFNAVGTFKHTYAVMQEILGYEKHSEENWFG